MPLLFSITIAFVFWVKCMVLCINLPSVERRLHRSEQLGDG